MINAFEDMLTGGHPNSLGRTEEVVELVLEDKQKMQDLFDCYQSADEVVRLRLSSAFKRIALAQPTWILPFFDSFVGLSKTLKQPSFQWSFAQIMLWVDSILSDFQRQQVIKVLKLNLSKSDDWIVLNMTMEALAFHSKSDAALHKWLLPHLQKLSKDTRKSVSKRANKYLEGLNE